MSDQVMVPQIQSIPAKEVNSDPAPGHGRWALVYYGLPFALTLGIAYYLEQVAHWQVSELTFRWAGFLGFVSLIICAVLAGLHKLYAVNRADLRAGGRWYAADLSDERNVAGMLGIWFSIVGLELYLSYFGINVLEQSTVVANILNIILGTLQAPFIVALWLASTIATPGVLLIVGAVVFWLGYKQHAQRNAGQKGLSFQTWLLFAAILGAFFLSLTPYLKVLLPMFFG
ncbi:hypothetical protein KFU94_15105 [Chloroflexi bacterium TSY]|nr:hypothetical protein [Chloroflexi bacterium TSY]